MQYAGRLHVSVVSIGELMTWGLRKKASPNRLPGLLDFMKGIDILPVTPPIADEYGRLRAALLDAGRPTPQMDLWIAATAIYHGLTLVSHNTRDFAHIPGLKLDDWLTR
jgi:predicted nucleic acid-binding protein